MAAYSRSSFLQLKPHGGESNGELGLMSSSDVGCGAGDSLECGLAYPGENETNATVSSIFLKDLNKDEMHRHFEEGFLNIFIHYAQGIHNICIYANQDVYAKFCLSHDPERAVCTRIVKKGGKNPVFNQSLQIGLCHLDSVLKCEIWMSSQAVSYLEDQLLGFVLVPLSSLAGKGEQSQEYALSSTELFHSHAGTIKLTLMYHDQRSSSPTPQPFKGSVPPGDLLGTEGASDGGMASYVSSSCSLTERFFAGDYGNVEFPDIGAIAEDQQLMSKYLRAASNKGNCEGVVAAAAENGMITGPPYLQIGSVVVDQAACRGRAGEEQGEDKGEDMASMTDDCQIFHFPSPQVPNAEKNFPALSDVGETHSFPGNEMEASNSPSSTTYPTSSSSQMTSGTSSSQDLHSRVSAPGAGMQIESDKERAVAAEDALGEIVTLPLVNLTIETEGPKVVQQQIVDMYVKSMNQFTEALAKMQLPVDMDSQEPPPAKDTSSEHDTGELGKKNTHRIFYGSRAFF